MLIVYNSKNGLPFLKGKRNAINLSGVQVTELQIVRIDEDGKECMDDIAHFLLDVALLSKISLRKYLVT